MLTRIQALNFRSLHHIDQRLESFHVLVGPNASGKTTFLDAISFLSDLISKGLDEAISKRTSNFQDLLWQRQGNYFELAIEAEIPEEQRLKLPPEHQKYNVIRYEVAIKFNQETNEVEISSELVVLKVVDSASLPHERLPANVSSVPTSVVTPRSRQVDTNHMVVVLSGLKMTRTQMRVKTTNRVIVSFFSEVFPDENYEVEDGQKRQVFRFMLGLQRSALVNLPEDNFLFPVTTWFKTLLTEGVQPLILNGLTLRQASPPGQGLNFKADASNLPWVVDNLKKKSRSRFKSWIAHLQTSLPDIEDIRAVRRDDDRHMYLMVRYSNGVEVPSWMVSDGTLRLLALTLPAYVSDFNGIYLIEEPENGIHPRAIETMFQSLSSVYDAQILLATHSPIVLGIVEAEQVLCFSKGDEGATQIVRGDQHPALQNWHGETNLGTLFAAGVLS